jgi:hypothetical protein
MAHGFGYILMKLLFSSPNSALVGLAQSLLESANIASEIRNDGVSQAMPGLPFTPELWVLRDEDFEEARSLVSSSLSA